jgi:acyl-coenzyme A synthetase/AMP-(fatty) acid ligase
MLSPYDYLVYRARFDPEAVAVRRTAHQLTFRELLHLVRRFAHRLRRAGVRPGQIVVTSIADKGLDWVALLAIAHEAAVSCSAGLSSKWDLPFEYHWVLTDGSGKVPAGSNVITIDKEWQKADTEVRSIRHIPFESDDALLRIMLTSGTTGRPHCVGLSAAQVAGRSLANFSAPESTNAFSTLGLGTAADLRAAMSNLIAGSPVYVGGNQKAVVQMLRNGGMKCLFSSPIVLEGTLNEIDAGGGEVPRLEAVCTAGAPLSAKQRARVLARLSDRIINYYGSTEVGGICRHRITDASNPDAAGYPDMHAQVEVVDAEGRPVARGETGSVRVRTPFMVQSYIGDEKASAQAFRDGWFYPGDRGLFRADGLLVLAGRDSEIVNVGGMKGDPATLDEFLKAHPGVQDAAAFVAKSPGGADMLVAGIVATAESDLKALGEAVRRKFKPPLVPAAFVRIKEVPRNAMGKVSRAEMARRFAQRRKQAEGRKT